MNTYKWTAIAVAIAASGVVSAAAHSGAQERPSGTSDEITVTGCVRDAAGMTSATTATTSTTGSPASTAGESYVLANATPGSGDAAARSETATATTGTTGSTGSTGSSAAASGTTYALEGHESDLKKHVGHRIEVTGTAAAKSDKDATASTSTTTSERTTTGKGDGAAVGARLRVSSIRMISADCSRSGQ